MEAKWYKGKSKEALLKEIEILKGIPKGTIEFEEIIKERIQEVEHYLKQL